MRRVLRDWVIADDREQEWVWKIVGPSDRPAPGKPEYLLVIAPIDEDNGDAPVASYPIEDIAVATEFTVALDALVNQRRNR